MNQKPVSRNTVSVGLDANFGDPRVFLLRSRPIRREGVDAEAGTWRRMTFYSGDSRCAIAICYP